MQKHAGIPKISTRAPRSLRIVKSGTFLDLPGSIGYKICANTRIELHAMTAPRIASDLTVVIPTLGRDCLRDSVRALAEGSVRPAKVILAHQGVPGALAQMLEEFAALGLSVQYVHSDGRGAAAGRNAGIDCVETRFFATTDDDCIADSKWVEEMSTALTARPREIATGRVLAEEAGAPSTSTSPAPRLFTSAPLKGDHFCGGNFGTDVAIFKEVGPLDETELVRYCEDPEWAYRALKKGYPIHYWPQITVTHLHWRDNVGMAQVYSNYARSAGGWFGRELRRGRVSFLIRLGYELTRGAKRWSLGTLRGDYLRKVHGRAFVVDLLRGLAAGFSEK
jgi:GT2 family glycosyltransferase